MESNQIYVFHPNEEAEDYDKEEHIWRAQRELDIWVEDRCNLDEPTYFSGTNEMMKIFNQKCVIGFENLSAYAFGQCDHQCICEICYRNTGDIDIINCIVSTTKFK